MIGDKLGRLFEVGFNVGVVNYLHQTGLNPALVENYRQDLQQLSLPKMLKNIIQSEQLVDESDIQLVEKWTTFFLGRGFLAGLNFLPEYLEAVGWKRPDKIKLHYFQANFAGDNSLGTYPKSQEQFAREMLHQFDGAVEQMSTLEQEGYGGKGEFLRADTLLLLSYRGREYRVISLDLAVFSIRSTQDLLDLGDVEVLRRHLSREINYLKSKSTFSNLSVDTDGLNFTTDFTRFFTAFKRQDKETNKLIQAASYAASFAAFLDKYKILPVENSLLTFNVIGYTDRGMNALAVGQDNLAILQTCAEIYKKQGSDEEIGEARYQVLQVIQRNAARSFEGGRVFVNKLLQIQPGQSDLIIHQERVEDFFNTQSDVSLDLLAQLGIPLPANRTQIQKETNQSGVTLRNAHASLIEEALANPQLSYLFLTGNPGIGKTTAIVNFLEKHANEGFLFLYVSPRKQVNLDIIQKFREDDSTKLFNNDLIGINTNSEIIRNNGGQATVQYLNNLRQDTFSLQGIQFISADQDEDIANRPAYLKTLERTKEDLIEDATRPSSGVLNSTCEALNAIISTNQSNNIVATVTIQALKKLRQEEDTLKHFGKIFKSAYNRQKGEVIAGKMQQIAGRIKHLFIMVDEITGDDSGVEFLTRIGELLREYELIGAQHGFNTKVIVADASIVDPDVIKQHISDSSVEPDKIFFRRASKAESVLPLSKITFEFNQTQALVINANSYPASQLNFTYKVFTESQKYDPAAAVYNARNLTNRVQSQLAEDINQLFNQLKAGQILVYIQNKKRLSELIEKLKVLNPGRFESNEDYLEIHANLTDTQKKQIHTHIKKVKVVFMTASASRGLSFPKARHILVDVPAFDIESNLMEIIQVIYRGRGDYWDEKQQAKQNLDNEEKNLTFYLAGQAVYYTDEAEESAISLQESILNLLNILIILKASVMTRIKGSGPVGSEQFLIIPIGGKSVSAAGETFTSRMVKLIEDLEKEYYRLHKTDKGLNQLFLNLRRLLGEAQIVLTNQHTDSKSGELNLRSYLSLRRTFSDEFQKATSSNFEKLLDFKRPELGYVQGSLLIVPLKDKSVEESYLVRLTNELQEWSKNTELLNKMYSMSKSPDYTEGLRSAIREALDLIRLLQQKKERSQWLTQYSERDDQYYAIPLFCLISVNVLENYFASNPEEPEESFFKNLLFNYTRTLYPLDGLLPIGSNYGEFPFIIFKSYDLRQARSKTFTKKYIMTSRELNVLNLILSKE